VRHKSSRNPDLGVRWEKLYYGGSNLSIVPRCQLTLYFEGLSAVLWRTSPREVNSPLPLERKYFHELLVSQFRTIIEKTWWRRPETKYLDCNAHIACLAQCGHRWSCFLRGQSLEVVASAKNLSICQNRRRWKKQLIIQLHQTTDVNQAQTTSTKDCYHYGSVFKTFVRRSHVGWRWTSTNWR